MTQKTPKRHFSQPGRAVGISYWCSLQQYVPTHDFSTTFLGSWKLEFLGTWEFRNFGYTLLLILLNKIQNISVAMATPATPLTPSLLPARKMHFLPSTHNSSVLSLKQIVLLWLLAKTDQTKKNSNSWFFHAIFFIEFRTSILESELLKNTTTTIRKSKPSPIFFLARFKRTSDLRVETLVVFRLFTFAPS